VNGLADIELQQHQHRSAQYGFVRLHSGILHHEMILPRKHESNNEAR
jgi:hypothetical protein